MYGGGYMYAAAGRGRLVAIAPPTMERIPPKIPTIPPKTRNENAAAVAPKTVMRIATAGRSLRTRNAPRPAIAAKSTCPTIPAKRIPMAGVPAR